jgi:hypothetical protein
VNILKNKKIIAHYEDYWPDSFNFDTG